jgi:hypothetical protein
MMPSQPNYHNLGPYYPHGIPFLYFKGHKILILDLEDGSRESTALEIPAVKIISKSSFPHWDEKILCAS